MRTAAKTSLDPSGPSPRHIAAATIGNALEFYDFLTYAFFSIQIGHAFFPSKSAYGSLMLSLATFGAGFITRPIGALVIGGYADRVGRRPAMMLCFIMIGGSIIAMAIIPTYAAIGLAAPVLAVLARMVQGFSLGGEIGCNTAYLMEAAPSGKRGGVVAWQGASQNLALIAGGSIGVLLTLALPARALDAYGWRIAFLLGAVAIPFGVWLRRNLPETLDAPETGPMSRTPSGLQERHSTQEPSPSRLAQARAHWRVMLIGLVVLGSATIGNYSFSYIVTYAQNTLHFPAQIGFLAATFGYILSIPVMLLGGRLSDRYGRRPVNIVGNLIFLACIYPAFVWVIATRSPLALILGMTVLNGLSSFNAGSFYAGLAESLPKTIRGGGFGTVYSTAIALFGGTTQLMVTWLIHATGSAMAPAWYMIGATVIGQVGLWLMPESAPARLAPGFAEPKVAEIPA